MANPYIELYNKRHSSENRDRQPSEQSAVVNSTSTSTQRNPFIELYDAQHNHASGDQKKSRVGSGGLPVSGSPQQVAGSVYEQRKAAQQAAGQELKSSWWDYLGTALANNQQVQAGQMLSAEQGRQMMDAANRLGSAMQQSREANKVIDWEGRDELLKEYRRLDKIDNPQARQQAQAIREQLRQGDVKAGNLAEGGDMAYNFGDWTSRIVPGTVKNTAADGYNALLVALDLIAKAQSMQGPTENELITEWITGQAPGSTAQMRREGYESEEYQKFMQDRYAEASAIKASAQRDLQIAKENQRPVVQAGVDIGENIIEMGADAAIAHLTGGSSLIPMAVRVFGSGAMDAREQGYSLEQQAAYGAAQAAIEVFTEKIGGIGGRGKGWSDALADKLVDELAQSPMGKNALRFLIAMAEEGGEEVLSDFMQPLANYAAGMKLDGYNAEEMLYDFFIGSVVGGMSSVKGMTRGQQVPANVQQSVQGQQAPAQQAAQAPANQPQFQNQPKSEPQKRVARLVQQAQSQTDLARVLKFIADDPALAQSFKEVYGIEAEDHLMKLIGDASGMSPQEAAGANAAQENVSAPANTENAQQQAPGEFNNGPEVSDYLYGPEVDERAEFLGEEGEDRTFWDRELANRQAREQNEYMDAYREAFGGANNAGVDFLIGDQYNEKRGQKVRNSKLSVDAYVAQQNRTSKYTGQAWFDDAVGTAIEQIQDDGRNAGRIADGQNEWASFTPAERVEILRAATNGDYYVSDGKVIRAKREVESSTDKRSDDFYSEDLKAAGVEDVSPRQYQESSAIHGNEEAGFDYKRTNREAPPDYVGRMRGDYSAEELSELERDLKRQDARRHRENMEKWREEHYGGKLVTNPRLGTPNNSLRSDQLQRIMRSKEKLANLVKGEGNFKGWHVDRRFDMLRAMYPDANWQIDAETETISLPGDPVLKPSVPADVWRVDTTKSKKAVAGKTAMNGGISVEGLQGKVEQEKRRRTTGSGRITTEAALVAQAKRALLAGRSGNLGPDNLAGRVGSDQRGDRRGNEERNASAVPVLRSQEELSDYQKLLGVAKKRGWKPIGTLTQSMAKVNKFLNYFGIPSIHADRSSSTDNSGGFSDKTFVAIAWGSGIRQKAVHTVHEVAHVLTARKFGNHAAGSKLLLSSFAKSSLGREAMKAVGQVYRTLYEDHYANAKYGFSYDKLKPDEKAKIDVLIGAEIFTDVIANDASKFGASGYFGKDLFPAFSEFRQACLNTAVESGLITNEDLGRIEEFLSEGVEDDFRDELRDEKAKSEDAAKAYRESERKSDDIGKLSRSEFERRLAAGEFNSQETLRKAESSVVDAREPQYARQLNRENTDQQLFEERDLDRSGVDVDAEDFDDVPPAKPAPAPTEDRTEQIPESSAEYIQQTRLRKSDFERREAEREGMEAEHRAEEAQARKEIEHDEAYDQHAADVSALEDVKKQYGEKVHGKLTELSNKLSGLVGQKRLQGSGNQNVRGQVRETITYNMGGKAIEDFANTFKSFTEGKSTFSDFANAYLGLNAAKQNGKGSYFYDKTFGEQVEKLRDIYEEGGPGVFDGKGNLRPQFAKDVEELATRITHRVEYQQKMLDFRERLNSMFEGMSEKDLRERKTVLGKALQIVEQMQLRPSAAFKYMANFDRKNGTAWYELADMTRDATKNYINTYQHAQNYFQEVTEHKDWKKFSEGKIKVKNVIPGLNYDKLSANMAVSFLKTLETDGAMEHIIESGLVEMAATEEEYYDDRNNKGFGDNAKHSQKFDPISAETRKAIEEAKRSGDDYALDLAMEEAHKELETIKENLRKEIEGCEVAKAAYDASFAPIEFLKRALNKTSRAVWGTNVATQGNNYWSLLAGGVKDAGQLLNDHSFGLNEQRIVQARTGPRGGLRIMAFTDMMQSYMQRAANWSSYQQLSDALQVLSREFYEGQTNHDKFGPMSSITQTLQNMYGQKWADWLQNYEDDLNGERGDKTDAWAKLLRGLRSNVAQGSLVLNGSVALKQAPSMLDFMGFLDADIVAKRFAKGFWRSAKSFNNNALIQMMEGYTQMLQNRKAGYNTVEEGDATAAGRKGLAGKLVSKLPSWMTNWITKTDYRTVANGMLACADQVDKWIDQKKQDYDGLKKGSDAYYQAIADLFENAVMDTQPIYNKQYRADALRTNNELVRSLSMFSTQQTQNYNNLVESFGEFQAAKRNGDKEQVKAARARFAQTVSGQVASQVMFAFLDGMAKLMLHKKKQYEDEDGNFDWGLFAAKNGYTFANSVLSTSWLARQLAPAAIDIFTGQLSKRTGGKVPESSLYYGTEEAALSLIGDFVSAAKDFSKESNAGTAKNLVFATSSLLGLPTRNVYNMLNAVAMHSLDFDWGSSVNIDKLLGIENLPSLKGMNARNEDDFLNMLYRYHHEPAESRGKETVEKAIAMSKAGNDYGTQALLSTIDLDNRDMVSGVKSKLREFLTSGKISADDFDEIHGLYLGTDPDDIQKAIDKAKEEEQFSLHESDVRAQVGDREYKKFTESMKDYNETTDPSGVKRLDLIADLGLSASDTDAYIKHYMSSSYVSNYSALRDAGVRSSAAQAMLYDIDSDRNGKTSQEEVYNWLLGNPRDRKAANAIWSANEWKKDMDEFGASYEKKPSTILTRYGYDAETAKQIEKDLNVDGENSVTQADFFAYLSKHPDMEEALRAVFESKWPKSNYESKKRQYS